MANCCCLLWGQHSSWPFFKCRAHHVSIARLKSLVPNFIFWLSVHTFTWSSLNSDWKHWSCIRESLWTFFVKVPLVWVYECMYECAWIFSLSYHFYRKKDVTGFACHSKLRTELSWMINTCKSWLRKLSFSSTSIWLRHKSRLCFSSFKQPMRQQNEKRSDEQQNRILINSKVASISTNIFSSCAFDTMWIDPNCILFIVISEDEIAFLYSLVKMPNLEIFSKFYTIFLPKSMKNDWKLRKIHVKPRKEIVIELWIALMGSELCSSHDTHTHTQDANSFMYETSLDT